MILISNPPPPYFNYFYKVKILYVKSHLKILLAGKEEVREQRWKGGNKDNLTAKEK